MMEQICFTAAENLKENRENLIFLPTFSKIFDFLPKHLSTQYLRDIFKN